MSRYRRRRSGRRCCSCVELCKIDEDALKSPLPMVEGVGPSCQWLPAGGWATVLDFLAERYPGVGAAAWLSRMRKGEVVDEAGRRIDAGSPYRAGACIFYYRELEAEERIPFDERVL